MQTGKHKIWNPVYLQSHLNRITYCHTSQKSMHSISKVLSFPTCTSHLIVLRYNICSTNTWNGDKMTGFSDEGWNYCNKAQVFIP